MNNAFGLDADYFNKLFARELNPEVVANQTPECLARVLARAALTACPGVLREEEFNWRPLHSVGQLQEGDKIRFVLDGKEQTRRVKEVINPGTDKEEVIYNKRRNFYFITRMALDGSSRVKGVMIRIRPNDK